MGDGIIVSWLVFPGHAVENFFSAGSASALCSQRPARFPIRRPTVPGGSHQSQNWVQMARAFSHGGRARLARPLAPPPRFAPAHTPTLASRHPGRAPPASQLGWQKDLCPLAPTTSPRAVAQAAHHHRLAATLEWPRPAAAPGAARTRTAPRDWNHSPSGQRCVDRGFQRLVSHPGRPAGRPADRARSVQPVHPGHPLAGLGRRPDAPVFSGVVCPLWPAQGHPRGSWRPLCRRRPLGFVPAVRLVVAVGDPCGVHAPGVPARQRRARTDASHLQARHRHTPGHHASSATAPLDPVDALLQPTTSARGLGATVAGHVVSPQPPPLSRPLAAIAVSTVLANPPGQCARVHPLARPRAGHRSRFRRRKYWTQTTARREARGLLWTSPHWPLGGHRPRRLAASALG